MTKSCRTKTLDGREYRCSFELTLQVIGGKWKPILLDQLAREGVLRFGELKKAIPGITERMLTRQLRELEKDGLLHREVYREVPPKVEYSLLPAGARLIPVLLALRQWGAAYEEERLPGAERIPPETTEQQHAPAIAPRYRPFLTP